jgi:hypothetical protein
VPAEAAPLEEVLAEAPVEETAAPPEEVLAEAPVEETAAPLEEVLAEESVKETAPAEEARDPGETRIGNYRIRFEIPPEILREAKTCNPEYRTRIAGSLAARAMNENPHLVASPMADPVVIWSEIKEALLRRLVA